MYDRYLTQAEIQGNINHVNGKRGGPGGLWGASRASPYIRGFGDGSQARDPVASVCAALRLSASREVAPSRGFLFEWRSMHRAEAKGRPSSSWCRGAAGPGSLEKEL